MLLNLRTSLFGAGTARRDWTGLEGTKVSSRTLGAILTDDLKHKVFTPVAHRAAGAEVHSNFPKWQVRQIDSCCCLRRTDDELILEMPVQHWEALIGQSIFFDKDLFINETNGLYTRYGWYVHSYSMQGEVVDVDFRIYAGSPRKYLPHHLFYMTAIWNKASVLGQGLLACSHSSPADGRSYCEYDVFLKDCDMGFIRYMANSMYDIGYVSDRSITGPFPFLPIIVFRIDSRMFPTGRLPYFEDDGETIRSYAYVPPAAIDAIIYEDVAPASLAEPADRGGGENVGSLLDRAKQLAQTLFRGE